MHKNINFIHEIVQRIESFAGLVFRLDIKMNKNEFRKKKWFSQRAFLIEPPAVYVSVHYAVCRPRVVAIVVLPPELIELIGVVTREFNPHYLFPSLFITRDRVPRAKQ